MMLLSNSTTPCHWSQAKVPLDGALVKVDDGLEKSPMSSGPKVFPGYRKRASTLGVISEHSEKSNEKTEDLCTNMERRYSSSAHSPTKSSKSKSSGFPTAKAGYIKALGENVKCKFKIDNPVLAFCGTQNQTSNENDKQETIEDAIRNIAIKGNDYIIVSDATDHVVPIPDSITLQVAAQLGERGVQALAIAKDLEIKCRELFKLMNNEKPEKLKVLLVCTDEMSLLIVSILSLNLGLDFDLLQATIAMPTDIGMTWLKRNFPKVGVVQWNNDAYEQVLFERTKDACRGLVDLAISFDMTMRSLLRSINCLKENGHLFWLDEAQPCVQNDVESTAKSKRRSLSKVPFRSSELLRELIDLVAEDKILIPHSTHLKKVSSYDSSLRARSYSTDL